MDDREMLICASADLVDGGLGVRFDVPAPQKLGAGDTVTTHAGSASDSAPAFAIRFRGKVAAYYNRCGHVPVELDWQQREFFDHSGLYLICATHGALYAPESGRCLGGRCNGRGLTPLPVVERDGQVFLILEGGNGG